MNALDPQKGSRSGRRLALAWVFLVVTAYALERLSESRVLQWVARRLFN
jgi:hypothetical protein